MGNKKIIITESQLKMIAKHNTSKKDSNVDNNQPINESTEKESGPSLNDAQLLMKKVFNQLSK